MDKVLECQVLGNRTNKKIIGKEFVIPKNSIINTNLNHIMRGSTYTWGDNPLKMNLNHWNENKKFNLNYDSKNDSTFKFKQKIESIPFSIGHRHCPAQSMAKKALYLILANVIVNFTFAIAGEKDKNKDKEQSIAKMNNTGIFMVIEQTVPIGIQRR